MYHKSRKYRRRQRDLHIRRKEAIIRATWYSTRNDIKLPVRGTLAKGKVHCSCGLCSFHSYTEQDRRHAVGMMQEIKEEGLETVSVAAMTKLQKMANNSVRHEWHGAANRQKGDTRCDYGEWLAVSPCKVIGS